MDTDGRTEARRGTGSSELLEARGTREIGRGGGAPRPRLSRLRLSAAAAQDGESGENEIRVTVGFSLCFYTTRVYLWAILDHGPGWKFK